MKNIDSSVYISNSLRDAIFPEFETGELLSIVPFGKKFYIDKIRKYELCFEIDFVTTSYDSKLYVFSPKTSAEEIKEYFSNNLPDRIVDFSF